MAKLKDSDIRELLKKKFTSHDEFILDPTTIIVDELDVCSGSARVDVAVINGKLHGYEIKSERDNLERLPSQIEFYNKIFDTVTLVVSQTHLAKARQIAPKWWGLDCVITRDRCVSLKTFRKPKRNKSIQILDLTQLLWKEELIELLEHNSFAKGVKSKTRFQLGRIITEKIEHNQVTEYVRNKLKSRKVWRAVPIQQLCDDLQ